MGVFFKSKEEKIQERQAQEEKQQKIASIVVSTLHTCDRPFEVLEIVTSGLDDGTAHFSTVMDEIKKEAYFLDADAVIGITFQTVGLRESVDYANHTQFLSGIKSRAVGTAIKYIE